MENQLKKMITDLFVVSNQRRRTRIAKMATNINNPWKPFAADAELGTSGSW